MPFVKGNTIGSETRFKTGQSGNPAGRPPDKLRRFIYDELDKVEREAAGKQEAVTKLQMLAERIVEDAIAGCIASRNESQADERPDTPGDSGNHPAGSDVLFD